MSKKCPKLWYENLSYPQIFKYASVGARLDMDGKVKYRLHLWLPSCCKNPIFTLTEYRVKELWDFLSGYYRKNTRRARNRGRNFPCAADPTATFCVKMNYGPDIIYRGGCDQTERIEMSYYDLISVLDFLKRFMVKCEENR